MNRVLLPLLRALGSGHEWPWVQAKRTVAHVHDQMYTGRSEVADSSELDLGS